jgi:hypothetical protein
VRHALTTSIALHRYTVTDAAGNTADSSRLIHVVEAEAPAITLLGANPALFECSRRQGGSTYEDAGAVATQQASLRLTGGSTASCAHILHSYPRAASGDYSVTLASGQALGVQCDMDTNAVGYTYHLRTSATTPCSALGLEGLPAALSPARAEWLQVHYAASSIASGRSADQLLADLCGGPPNALASVAVDSAGFSAVASNAVVEFSSGLAPSLGTAGVYSVFYDAVDSNGRHAAQATRQVEVLDTTPPVLTLLGSLTLCVELDSAEAADAANILDSYGLTCEDACGGGIGAAAAIASASAPVNASAQALNLQVSQSWAAPMTQALFGTVGFDTNGTYERRYTCTDAAGNSATATRVVHVQAAGAPLLTVHGDDPLTLEAAPKEEPFANNSKRRARAVDVACHLTHLNAPLPMCPCLSRPQTLWRSTTPVRGTMIQG